MFHRENVRLAAFSPVQEEPRAVFRRAGIRGKPAYPASKDFPPGQALFLDLV